MYKNRHTNYLLDLPFNTLDKKKLVSIYKMAPFLCHIFCILGKSLIAFVTLPSVHAENLLR